MRRPVILSVRAALLVVTLVSLVPALIIIVGTGIEHGRYLQESVAAEALRQVDSIAQIQHNTVISVERIMTTVASMPAFRTDDFAEQQEAIASVLSRFPFLSNIAVVDLDGFVTVSPGLPRGHDLSDRRHVQEAIRTGEFVAGEFILARTNGESSFPFACPIFDSNDEIKGALTLIYPTFFYEQYYDQLNLPEDAMMAVLDHSGIRLFYRPETETNRVGEKIQAAAWERTESGGDTGTYVMAGSDGTSRIYAYRKLYVEHMDDPYLVVYAGFPERLATQHAMSTMRRNLLFMGIVITAAVILALTLGDFVIARGVNLVAETARAISAGDLSARTNLDGGTTEIEMLAATIDEMAERLQLRRSELEAEEERLATSLREKETLLKEIHHRVKNNMQMILSIVHLQRGSLTDIDAFCADLETRISAMADVHELLYQSRELSTIDMTSLLERLAETAPQQIRPTRITVDCDSATLHLENAIPIALMTSELIMNAGKYGAGPDGVVQIAVSYRVHDDRSVLTVADGGPGFPDGFDPDTVSSLGVYLVSSLAAQMDGSAVFASDGGATVTVTLPRTTA